MINSDAHLDPKLFDKPTMAATREGFGKGVVEAGQANSRVVVLTADLAESTAAHHFREAFPERFVQVGVAEQNLVTVASGMASYGKIPFATSYAAFSPGRNWEQIRTTIALNNVPVVICGMHAGVLTGPDGATHQMLEDVALMRALPNMIVLSPCDAEQGKKATLAAAKMGSPVYLRFAREKTPTITTPNTPFAVGKAVLLWNGDMPKVTIFATGTLVHNALLAAKQLEGEGVAVSVVDIHTIKPLDREAVIRFAKEAGAVVSVEEHQIHGGLGGAIAEVLAQEAPMPMEFVAVKDRYGQSGEAKELIEHYELGVSHIIAAVKKVMTRSDKARS